MMTQIDTFQKEKLQSLLNANKAEFDLKLEEMKQTLLKYNTELDMIMTANDNKSAVYTLQSQVESLEENVLSLFFDGE